MNYILLTWILYFTTNLAICAPNKHPVIIAHRGKWA